MKKDKKLINKYYIHKINTKIKIYYLILKFFVVYLR